MRCLLWRLLPALGALACAHPPAPAPAAKAADPAPSRHAFLRPEIAKGQLAIDPQQPPYRAQLPPELQVHGYHAWAMVKICADRNGDVERVDVIKGAHPLLDDRIVVALKTWRYRPYLLNGRPVPFCTYVRYEMNAR
jgi:protein TonB